MFRILLGFDLQQAFLINVVHACFFFNYSHNYWQLALKHKHIWRDLNESSIIDRCFSFLLTCFSLVTFPRNLAQIFISDRFKYVRNIFFLSFYTFAVMTHFVEKESFLNKYLTTLFEYNSWDLNTVASFSAECF